jgi:RHS repeat-associated protein
VIKVCKQFTQKERDEESGLDYFEARYYSSIQGRFTSVDPLMASGNAIDPQTWNRYVYVSNNPLRYVDDNGLIKRDKNGNIIFTPVGSPIVQTHPSGASTTLQPGYIEADNGDRIEVFENVGNSANFDIRFECDCHGLTFADGKYWINNDQVGRLLAGDNYEQTNTPQIGDVTVYTEGGQVVHSTTVTAVEGGNVTEVSGLGGVQVASETTTPQGAWPGATVTYYRKKDDNRTPEQRRADATEVKNYDKGTATIGKQIERDLGPPPPPPPPPQPKRGKRGPDDE